MNKPEKLNETRELEEPKESDWQVYIIQTVSGKLYTGITTDLERRYRQHKGDIKGGARFFRSSPAKKIVFTEWSNNRSSATKRELEIKQLSRDNKLRLIAGELTV